MLGVVTFKLLQLTLSGQPWEHIKEKACAVYAGGKFVNKIFRSL